MMTETLLLSASENDIEKAGRILRDGGLVAIPTETVYGLAASAFCAEAVSHIFEAKGRPGDNPLIVHICSFDELKKVCCPNESAYKLAEAFWPGPMTMILPKKKEIPYSVTAGLETVAVRMPSHPVARAVIKSAGVPLAAPSANLSGKPSPTTAEHVISDLAGRIDAVIDGGPCEVGVESTVIDLTGDVPVVLRPGAVTREMIAVVMGSAVTDKRADNAVVSDGAVPSPGMKYRHYAPDAPVTLYCGAPEKTVLAMEKDASMGKLAVTFDEYAGRFEKSVSLGMSWDHGSHASSVYAALRYADEIKAQSIMIACPRESGHGSATANRLKRAAGFNIINVSEYPVIGVTGPSGAGKSTAARALAKNGCILLDADGIYHRLLDESAEMNGELKEAFPEAYETGAFDRRKMASLVFGNKEKLGLLNSITHRYVKDDMLKTLAAAEVPVVMDVPLLFESGLDRLCTCILGVVDTEKRMAERIVARDGISKEEALTRLGSSKPAEWYEKRCNIVIENRWPEEEISDRIAEIIKNEKIFF